MTTSITYIILLRTQENNVPKLAANLNTITGKFRKEYIIVDDCSTDNTLAAAQEAFGHFPRATILCNTEYRGTAYSVNLALKLSHGDYVHFIDGDEIVTPNSTEELLNACDTMGCEVAYGLHGTLDGSDNKFVSPYETGEVLSIESPIKAVLDNRIRDIRKIGYSASLISMNLLEKINGADDDLFLHNLSLGLRCGKYSKFAAVKKTLCYSLASSAERYDKKFETYNNLLAIEHFMEDHKEIAEQYKPEIYKALWTALWNLGKQYKVQSLPRYLLSRYVKRNLDSAMLLALYRDYITRLELE